MVHSLTVSQMNQLTRYTDDLRQLCQPMFRGSPVDYVEYGRYYLNGQFAGMSTQPERIPYIFDTKCYPIAAELERFVNMGMHVTFLSEAVQHDILSLGINITKFQRNIQICTEIGSVHRLCFVEKKQSYFQVIIFSSSNQCRQVIDIFLNYIEFFSKFSKYVASSISRLLDREDKNQFLYLPEHDGQLNSMPKEVEPVFDPEAIMREISGSELFTVREMQCMRLLAKGFTMKGAAKELDISPRTVEQHLRNMKEKHGLHSKQSLIEFWHQQTA